MAHSQMTTLRVVLFTLTICGALFGVMTSPVEQSTSSPPSTPSPLTLTKQAIDASIQAIDLSLKPFVESATKIEKLVKLKAAIEELKTASNAQTRNITVIDAAAEKVTNAASDQPPEIKSRTSSVTEQAKKSAYDQANFEKAANDLTGMIEPMMKTPTISNENIKPLEIFINQLMNFSNVYTETKNAANNFKSKFDSAKMSAGDETKKAETLTAFLEMANLLSKVKEATDKLNASSALEATTKAPASAPEATTKAPALTTPANESAKEAGFFSGYKLVIIIVVGVIALVGIIGGVFYCMKNRD